MHLSEVLQNRSFVEWNFVVKGLVQIWELARMLGIEQALEEQLKADHTAELSVRLGHIGNNPALLMQIIERCWWNLAQEHSSYRFHNDDDTNCNVRNDAERHGTQSELLIITQLHKVTDAITDKNVHSTLSPTAQPIAITTHQQAFVRGGCHQE